MVVVRAFCHAISWIWHCVMVVVRAFCHGISWIWHCVMVVVRAFCHAISWICPSYCPVKCDLGQVAQSPSSIIW